VAGASTLRLTALPPLNACNAGLFVSRGKGIHPDRVMDSYELIYVRRGILSMQEGAKQFEIHPGETLLLWPGRRHFGTRPYSADLSFYWIHFRIDSRRRMAKELTVRIPQHGALSRDDRLAELFHRFLDDQETGALKPLSSSYLIALMLFEVAESQRSAAAAAGDAAAALASRAQHLIQTRFHQNISTADNAGELSCNPDYLGRVFRRVYGHTLIDEIHLRRLRSARRLLIESTFNVDQIATECGFQDSGYFRRIFRRKQGVSPRAYRQLFTRAHVNTE